MKYFWVLILVGSSASAYTDITAPICKIRVKSTLTTEMRNFLVQRGFEVYTSKTLEPSTMDLQLKIAGMHSLSEDDNSSPAVATIIASDAQRRRVKLVDYTGGMEEGTYRQKKRNVLASIDRCDPDKTLTIAKMESWSRSARVPN
jgi:hypothetical protein